MAELSNPADFPADDAVGGTELIPAYDPTKPEGSRRVHFTPAQVLAYILAHADTSEKVRDVVAAFLTQGDNITLMHDDPGDTLDIDAAGGGGGTADGSEGIEGSDSVLRFQYGNGSAGSTAVVGLAISNQGSPGSPTVTTTNRLTRAMRHTRITSSAAGSEAGLRSSSQIAWREAGFTYEFRGGIEVVSGADMRLFIGLRGSTGFPGNADPSGLTSIIGFGLDAADGNIQLMHNDAAGTATKVDTGIAPAAGDELYVKIHCAPGGDPEVLIKHFAAANLTATPTAMYPVSGTPETISTDIPAATQALAFMHWVNNAATAAAATIAMIRESLRSPF